MIGGREGASNLVRITWSIELRQGRTFVRSRTVEQRGGTTKMATLATTKSADTDNMSGHARYGVEVPVLILLVPLVRLMAELATLRKYQAITREAAAIVDQVAGEVEAPPEVRRPRPLHHLPAAAAAAAAAVRKANAGGVDVVVEVREGADVGEIVHLVAGKTGEDAVDVGRPPVVVQAQVAAAAAAAVVAVRIPRHHHPRRRGRNLGIARSAVGVEAHRVSPRG